MIEEEIVGEIDELDVEGAFPRRENSQTTIMKVFLAALLVAACNCASFVFLIRETPTTPTSCVTRVGSAATGAACECCLRELHVLLRFRVKLTSLQTYEGKQVADKDDDEFWRSQVPDIAKMCWEENVA